MEISPLKQKNQKAYILKCLTIIAKMKPDKVSKVKVVN